MVRDGGRCAVAPRDVLRMYGLDTEIPEAMGHLVILSNGDSDTNCWHPNEDIIVPATYVFSLSLSLSLSFALSISLLLSLFCSLSLLLSRPNSLNIQQANEWKEYKDTTGQTFGAKERHGVSFGFGMDQSHTVPIFL